jgi:hypothetical protein
MTIESGDQACLDAFTSALGHAPPFTEEELATIESLTVVHARDIALLEACVGLRHLRVIASEVRTFLFCDALPELAHLEVLASKVESLNGAAFCPKLARVDLLYTTVKDAAEVLAIPNFRRGTLIGNTWNSSSWSYLQSECPQPGMFVELPAEHDWKLTLALWEKAEACCGPIAGSAHFVVRPGLPQLTQNLFDALAVHSSTVDQEMDAADFSLTKMFSEYASRIATPDLSELAKSHTLGSSADAEQWIVAAAMADADKADLTRFVKRFPDVPFYFSSEALIERETKGEKFPLPAWYRTQRTTLDGWRPNDPYAAVRFDGDDLGAIPSKDYYLGLYPHASEYADKLIAAGFANVALSVQDPQAMLAMSLKDGDLQIYSYSFEDVSDAVSEGRDIAASFYPAFRSFASMLGHIVGLIPKDQDPILAS